MVYCPSQRFYLLTYPIGWDVCSTTGITCHPPYRVTRFMSYYYRIFSPWEPASTSPSRVTLDVVQRLHNYTAGIRP